MVLLLDSLRPLSHRLMGRSPKTRTPGSKAGCIYFGREYSSRVDLIQDILHSYSEFLAPRTPALKAKVLAK